MSTREPTLADRPVPYWPAYLPAGPGAAIPFGLTPKAEAALDDAEPEMEAEI